MLYRFNLDFSDIDRGIYQTLDFRINQHPSEAVPYLLTRALAYALSHREGLQFSSMGLADPDQPALLAQSLTGATELIIEIGNPSARRLHKDMKAANEVIVYTYKNPDLLVQEIKAGDVHRSNEIQIYALGSKFLSELENRLEKNNSWSVLHQDGRLDISKGDWTVSGEVSSHKIE